MVTVLVVIHTIVSIGLILAILLHRGKAYGLSMTMGGGLPSTFAGSGMIEKNLNRITVALAVTFALTSIVLYYLRITGSSV